MKSTNKMLMIKSLYIYICIYVYQKDKYNKSNVTKC